MVRQLEVEFRFNLDRLDDWLEKHGPAAESGLAYAIGCSPGFFYKLRSNPTQLPTGKYLAALSEVTKIPMHDLVVRVPKRKPA